MSEWKEVTLSDVTSVLGDGIHGTPKYSEDGDYYFINGNNLYEGKIVFKSDTKRVSEDEFLKYRKKLTDRTLLFSINGTVGNVAKYNGEPCILGKSACYFNIIDSVDKDYIYYVVSSPSFVKSMSNLANGTTIKNVSLKQMREKKLYLPPLEIQHSIASILSSLDNKIAVNKKICENLEAQAQALFKHWFVDFAPFKDGKFVESELGLIPEGWRVGNLFDVASIYDKIRKPLSGKDREYMNKIYPYYGATSCMDYVDSYLFDGIYTLIGEDGSVVKEDGLPYMQYGWGKFWVNNHAHILQGKNGFSTEMVHVFLSRYNIKHLVTGAVQAKLSQANMQKIMLPIPPKDEINKIRPVIDSLYEKIRNCEEESSRLSTLRDTLLPKLMSGEIKVDDVK